MRLIWITSATRRRILHHRLSSLCTKKLRARLSNFENMKRFLNFCLIDSEKLRSANCRSRKKNSAKDDFFKIYCVNLEFFWVMVSFSNIDGRNLFSFRNESHKESLTQRTKKVNRIYCSIIRNQWVVVFQTCGLLVEYCWVYQI